jgi:hypothetical protein
VELWVEVAEVAPPPEPALPAAGASVFPPHAHQMAARTPIVGARGIRISRSVLQDGITAFGVQPWMLTGA